MDKVTALEQLKLILNESQKEILGEVGIALSSTWNEIVDKKLGQELEKIRNENEKKVSFSTQIRKSTKDRLDEYIHKTKKVESISDITDRAINSEIQKMSMVNDVCEDT